MPSSVKISSLMGGEIGMTGTAIGNTGFSVIVIVVASGADGIVGTTNSSC
jgi:hypothetical protein